MELFKASKQWSTRPPDERFWDIEDGQRACEAYQRASIERPAPHDSLRAEAIEGDVQLVGRSGVPARLTNYAFRQLSSRAGCPAGYLQTLPATLAVQNLNHGLKANLDQTAQSNALMHSTQSGELVMRCIVSEKYDRIWNASIFERLRDLKDSGWRVPPARPASNDPRARPATAEDVLQSSQSKVGLAVREGDMIAPAGVYVSDHDMFVFMVDEAHALDNGSGDALARGFFCWNSEVGDKSFGVMTFLYDAICGNHIVWGAKDVKEIRIRHVGREGRAQRQAFRKLQMELREYSNASASDDQARIQKARTLELGSSKDEVLENLFGLVAKKRIAIAKGSLEAAYDVADTTPRYGSPRTPWGIAQGLTELSQNAEYAEKRVEMDRAAGRILQATVF